jgi:hypothetical protein
MVNTRYNWESLSGEVVQRWVSATFGKNLTRCFWFVYFCMSVYFKTSEK